MRISLKALTPAVVVLVLALMAAAPVAAQAEEVKLYLLKGEQFRTVTRDIQPGPEALAQTVRSLIKGPTEAEREQGFGTAIPRSCRLVSARVDASAGRAVLAFTRRCAATREVSRSPEDDVRIFGARVAQVVYTVTAATGVADVELQVPGRQTVIVGRDELDPRRYAFPKPDPPAGPRPDDARGVQLALARLHYLPRGAVNGRWDYRTQQATMAFQSWEGLLRDGIVGKQTTGRLATAGVPRPLERGRAGRRVEIHRSRGVVLLIQNGVTVRAIHTSTGVGGNSTTLGTPPGRFKIYRKELRSWSVPYQVWLPYAAYWYGGWAMHGYPDVPAFPASHGCARLPMPEAPVMFDFVRIGTPVRVI